MPIHNTGPKSHTGTKNNQAPALNSPDGKRLGIRNGQVGKQDGDNSARNRALDRRESR